MTYNITNEPVTVTSLIEPVMVNEAHAAQLMGLPLDEFRQLASERQLNAVTLGSKWMYSVEQLRKDTLSMANIWSQLRLTSDIRLSDLDRLWHLHKAATLCVGRCINNAQMNVMHARALELLDPQDIKELDDDVVDAATGYDDRTAWVIGLTDIIEDVVFEANGPYSTDQWHALNEAENRNG